MNLYNEIEPNAGEWMQNLMDAGEIPQGKIDARPIQQLAAADFDGITQFHTFAGIGGWPLALRLAGWPEDREVWTGSCPCQPYSSAGKQKGNADERDLWPAFFALVKERRPKFIFGEQVASAIKHGWLDRVYADLEGIGYTVGSAVLGAHSVGAPHIRQRIYWVATLEGLGNADSAQNHAERRLDQPGRNAVERGVKALSEREAGHDGVGRSGEVGGLGDSSESGHEGRIHRGTDAEREDLDRHLGCDGAADGMADAQCGQYEGGIRGPRSSRSSTEERASADAPRCGTDGPWSDYRVVPCTDGKARRTGARVFPLAYGLPRSMGALGPKSQGLAGVAGLGKESIRRASRARIGMLKGSGNAIVPALAAEFIMAFMETIRGE